MRSFWGSFIFIQCIGSKCQSTHKIGSKRRCIHKKGSRLHCAAYCSAQCRVKQQLECWFSPCGSLFIFNSAFDPAPMADRDPTITGNRPRKLLSFTDSALPLNDYSFSPACAGRVSRPTLPADSRRVPRCCPALRRSAGRFFRAQKADEIHRSRHRPSH